MRRSYPFVLSIFVCLVLSTPAAFTQKNSQLQPQQEIKPGILVELFTSEGCSSCPAADALLRELDKHRDLRTAEIVVLGEHVDYWDDIRWRDRFSSHEYTQRQEDYARKFRIAGPYTPQMVIDGETEFVGNDLSALESALQRARSETKAWVTISAQAVNAGELRVHIETGALPSNKSADLYVAIANNQDETRIGGGENSGRSLLHAAALRSLRRVAAVGSDGGTHDLTLALSKTQKLENTRIITFIQEPDHGNVLGAAVRIVGSFPPTR